MATLKFPDDVRRQLHRQYQNNHRTWLACTDQFPLTLKLGSPNEKQAQQLLETIQAWVSAWQSWQGAGKLVWCERRWRNLGIQRLPEQIILHTPTDVAAWVGDILRWEKAHQRYQLFVTTWPTLKNCIQRYFDILADYTDDDIHRLISVLTWIETNPQSHLYPRQLPLIGVDSKWLERRKSLINDLIATLQGNADQTLDFFQRCGLRQMPYTIRLRLLDKNMRAYFAGLEDISVPLQQLTKLNLSVAQVYIVENLQTGLAFDDLPNSIVLMQLGYNVEVLADLPWLKKADCIYWGDIDTHGFAILNRARSYLPHVRSLLMDEKTLHQHQSLWASEDKQHSAAEFPLLTESEQTMYRRLKQQHWGINVRLEQERIAWDYAWTEIHSEDATQSISLG